MPHVDKAGFLGCFSSLFTGFLAFFMGLLLETFRRVIRALVEGLENSFLIPKAEAQNPEDLARPQILLKTFGEEWQIVDIGIIR